MNLSLNPQALYLYKPQKSGSGVAAKFDLRATYTLNPNGFIDNKSVEGGLFVELAAQEGKGDDGFARFGWKAESLLKVKLGVPDITALLVALQSRWAKRPMLDRKGEPTNAVELFHKTAEATAAISYSMDPTGGFFRVSRSKDNARTIRLSLQDEVALQAYLNMALQAFLQVGL